MATFLDELKAARLRVVAAIAAHDDIVSYNIAGRSFSFSGPASMAAALDTLSAQIAVASPGGGFVLTKVMRE